METKGFIQSEIIINASASSFCFIWIPMLWVYGHYFFPVRESTSNVSSSRLKTVLKVLITHAASDFMINTEHRRA